MNLNPVIIAIPMYFTLMGIELMYEAITKKKTYRMNDAITNISAGTLQQLAGTFVSIIKVGIYVFFYEKLAAFHLDRNWTTFIAAFFLFDFLYYWEHRMAHAISLFWGGHVVHHQSEEFNLSVALRQTSTGFIWGFPFYLPMALLGFDPMQFVLVGGLNLLYQFWIHTEHIEKLPAWFELIFNTPSHHRVHHGRDPKYIDQNYAGVFIIWDRMFGTFTAEEERPTYGITKPLKSWNPVYANFAHYIDLFQTVKKARNFSDALKILFNKPGWMPAYLGGYQAPKKVGENYKKYNSSASRQMKIYVFVQFLALLAGASFYFFKNTEFDPLVKILFTTWIVASTLSFGFLFESKGQWLLTVFETLRLLAIPFGIHVFEFNGIAFPSWLFWVVSFFALASLIAFLRLKTNERVFEKPAIN